jgi:hypothetical protein
VFEVAVVELSDSDVFEVPLSDTLVDWLPLVEVDVEPLVEPLVDSEAVEVEPLVDSDVETAVLLFVESAGIVAVLFAASMLPVSASLLVLVVVLLVSAWPTIGAANPPPNTAAKLVMVV